MGQHATSRPRIHCTCTIHDWLGTNYNIMALGLGHITIYLLPSSVLVFYLQLEQEHVRYTKPMGVGL